MKSASHPAPSTRMQCSHRRRGSLPSRSPRTFYEVFTSCSTGLRRGARDVGRMARRGDTTRRLERHRARSSQVRHSDGRAGARLPRPAAAVLKGRLEHVLATSGIRAAGTDGLAMGYARLAEGRTTVIMDAAPPPEGETIGQRPCLDTRFRR